VNEFDWYRCIQVAPNLVRGHLVPGHLCSTLMSPRLHAALYVRSPAARRVCGLGGGGSHLI